MALVYSGVITVTIPLTDITGSRSQFQMNFKADDPTALPSAIAAIVAGVPGIEALSGASASGLTLSIQYREDDVTTPDANSRVERRGRWDLINVNGNRFYITVPAIDPTLVDSNGYINRSHALVTAFENFLLNSSACDSRGVEVGGIIDAREVYRASTRSSAPKIRG